MKTFIDDLKENKERYALLQAFGDYIFVNIEFGSIVLLEDPKSAHEAINFALHIGLKIFDNPIEFEKYLKDNKKTLIEEIKEDKEKYALIKYPRGYLFARLDSHGSFLERDSELHDETVKFALNFGLRIFENYDEYIDYLKNKKASKS